MSRLVSIDFKIVPSEKAVVSVMDRSFLYGDSIYEAVRAYQGTKPFLLDRHYARLLRSADRIGLHVPFSEKDLRSHLDELLSQVDHGDSYVRIVVTRGIDDRFDVAPHEGLKPLTVIFVNPVHQYAKSLYEDGLNVALVSVRRNLPSAVDPNIKTGNYMNNVIAKIEAQSRGANDAIMLNHEDCVTECTTSNLFVVKDGVVMTPEVRSGLLEGVSRRLLLDLLKREDIPFRETLISKESFLQSDEIFVTSTTKEIMPVTMVDDRPVGSGKPGEMTQKLMGLFHEEVCRLLS